MNDKLKIIAEYDGWKNVGVKLMRSMYLTSLDFLHPVAMKVLRQLIAYADRESHIIETAIKQACCKPPINGEYSDLFDATVEGIIYLQNQSK